MADEVLDLGPVTVDLERGTVSGARTGRLTNRELALLRFLAARPGEVVDRDTLLHEVFGYAPRTVSRAVDKAMDSLRAKVEADKRVPTYLLTVHGTGYRLAIPAPDRPASLATADRRVGRTAERLRLREALAGPGVTTLHGPGGVGKTRLAREETADLPHARACELSHCRTAADVLTAIEASLSASTPAGGVPARIAHLMVVVAARPVVLVLDDAEHVLDTVRPIAAALGEQIPVLITSRIRLDLPGERVIPVDPLPRADAVRLFRELAGAVNGTDDEVGAVVEWVDRLPLGIELAARRARLLSVPELARRLAHSHALLTGADHGVEATVGWSWDLLDPAQQAVLRQAAVFAGGFSLDAAEAVLAPPAGAPPVLDLLQSLVEASLLRTRPDGRIELYHLVRQFARDRGPTDPEVGRRHGAYFGALAARLARGTQLGSDAVDALERELPNLRAVFFPGSGADPADQVRARFGVSAWMRIRAAFADHAELLDGALEAARASADVDLLVRALLSRAMLPVNRHLPTQRGMLDEALALARASGDPDVHLRALVSRIAWMRHASELDEAAASVAEANELRSADVYLQVGLAIEAASVVLDRSAMEDGLPLMEAAVTAAAEAGLAWSTAFGRLSLGGTYLHAGRCLDARRQYTLALEGARALRSDRLEAPAALGLAEVAALDRRWDEVATHAGRALALARPQLDRRTAAAASLQLALRALLLDRDEEAEEHAAAGLLESASGQPLPGLLTLARTLALTRLGRWAEADAALADLERQPSDPWFGGEVRELRPVVEAVTAARRRPEAVPALLALLEQAPVDPLKPEAAFYTVAWIEAERAGTHGGLRSIPSGRYA